MTFHVGPLCGLIEPGIFWLRLFGYGIHGQGRKRPLLFSERNGHTRSIRIAGWRFRLLPRWTP